MAEREALQKEIEELQNLIKDHKRVHGDVPSGSAQWFSSRPGRSGGRGHSQRYVQSYSGSARHFTPHSGRHWREAYSVNNKATKTPGEGASWFSQDYLNKTLNGKSVAPSSSLFLSNSKLANFNNSTLKGTAEACASKDLTASLPSVTGHVLLSESNRVPPTTGNRTVLKPSMTKNEKEIKSSVYQAKSDSGDLDKKSTLETKPGIVCNTATSFQPLFKTTSAFNKKETSATLQVKPVIASSISQNRMVIMPAASDQTSSAPTLSPLAGQSTASNLGHKPDLAAKVQTTASHHNRSKFTWVKSQTPEKSTLKQETRSTAPSPNSAPSSAANVKPAPSSNKKLNRKASHIAASKTSKYTWVSSSCSTTPVAKMSLVKLPHKTPSPKAFKAPGKTAKEGVEGYRRVNYTPHLISKRAKLTGGTSTSQLSHANRYAWKAGGQVTSAAVCRSTSRLSRKGSVYRWTAQKVEKRDSGSRQIPSAIQYNPSTSLLTSTRFKLLRRSSSSSFAERKPGPGVVTVRSPYSLRRKTNTPMKTVSSVRRNQPKTTAVVWPSKTATMRVIKTRYKIDTRRAQFQQHNPALSYRVKKLQSARNFMQNRMWTGRGMRWIGGALYRVSANKLSRTSTPPNRSAKWYSPSESSPSTLMRTSSTQYVANRVIQKSLVTIRHAQQKKQHQAKQYCMYYNRFGKCNRGNACPYIHDPDKVAVCTRFLKGTCKQTDGTCPFSHKVAKEKMPVCSYFLKGICHNSSCPYSHVNVSRNAALCQDFIRGYCPLGEKCKKKHTLVCPEFFSTGVCPRGSKCKLRHRQRTKRTKSSSSSSSRPAKIPRTVDPEKRPEDALAEASQTDEGKPVSGLAKLPSFIPLSTSPDLPESPETSPAQTEKTTAKKLHIKPRI